MNDLLNAAVDYIRRDYPVFPLHNPEGDKCSCRNPNCDRPKIGKHPRTAHGFKDATTDELTIRKWWTDWPNANIGIPTGASTGLAVIDRDSPEAELHIRELCSDNYDFSVVPCSRTGRGSQLFFAYPDIRVSSRSGILEKVDFRGEGGYIVAPPSRHINGQIYRWEVELTKKLPTLPAELLQVIQNDRKPNQEYGERFDTVRALNGVPEGQRDDMLFRFACSLRSANVPEDYAVELMLKSAQKCQPPFPKELALQKVAYVYGKYEPRQSLDSFPHLRQSNPAELNLELRTWEQFLSAAPTLREWTVHEIIPETGLGVIQGRGKQGKSTVVIHLSRSVGTGKPFLGRDTKQKPVVYINYEMPDDYLQQLIRSGEIPSQCFVVNRPGPTLSLNIIKSIISKVGSSTGLLVIDSFRGAFKLTGKAENLAGEAGVLLRQLQDLAIATGWVFLIVHHGNRSSREGTDSISGTSDWIAAPDVILSWWRPKVTEPGILTLEGRIPPCDPISVKLTLEECTCLGTVEETKEATDITAITAVLTDEGQTSEVIAEAAGVSPGTTRVRLGTMLKYNLLARSGVGRKNDPYLWSKIIPQENGSYSAETNAEINQPLLNTESNHLPESGVVH